MRRIILLLLWALVSCLSASLRAEFILDDFDDPAELISPEMEGVPINTEGVGDLSATRTLSIFDIFTDPQARLDSSLSRASHLTGIRSPANPSDGLGLARMGPIYRFGDAPQDFTESGQNDAFFVDYASITGPTPPPLLFGFVEDDGDFFEIFFDLTTVSAPATVVLPFDQFRPRGGGVGNTEFKNVTRISFSVTGNGTINGLPEEGWSFEIDRIRVGVIPEPTTVCLLGLASIVFACQRFPHGRRTLY